MVLFTRDEPDEADRPRMHVFDRGGLVILSEHTTIDALQAAEEWVAVPKDSQYLIDVTEAL